MNPNHTCPICGYRPSLRWIEYLADLANLAIPAGHTLGSVIVKCEECSPAHPVVIPYHFRPGIDFWT